MTTYRVGLAVRDGAVDAWTFDLPGCRAIAGSVDEAMALLPAVIADHLVWLGVHGDKTDPAAGIDVAAVEEVHSGAEFVFEDDKRPVTAQDIEDVARWVGFAHHDLVSITAAMPAPLLEWRVPPSAVKIDDRYPDVRSIRDMLQHVGSAMSFHVRGVGDVHTRVPSPAGEPTLATAFETTLARLRALDEAERSGKVYRTSGPRGEAEWTARKSMRRIINHQRFHTREVQQRLCWLTLGVPEVLPESRE